jgi:hypothetical protein
MPIRVVCECGSRLDAPDSLAGRQAQCGNCGRVLSIEAPSTSSVSETVTAGKLVDTVASPRLPPRVIRKKKKKVFQETAPIADERSRSKGKRTFGSLTTAEIPRVRKEPSLLDVWSRGLTFPFRREAFITILVLATIYGPAAQVLSFTPAVLLTGAYGIKGLVGLGIISLGTVGYFCYFLLQTLRSAAQNEDDLPVASAFDFEEIFIDLWLVLGATALLFSPLLFLSIGARLSGEHLPAGVVYALLGLFAFLWPMAVTSSALHTSVLAANHWTVARAILRMPLQYTVSFCLAMGLIVIAVVIDLLTPRVVVLSGFIFWLLVFITLTGCMYLVGNLYYRNRRRIGWFEELEWRYWLNSPADRPDTRADPIPGHRDAIPDHADPAVTVARDPRSGSGRGAFHAGGSGSSAEHRRRDARRSHRNRRGPDRSDDRFGRAPNLLRIRHLADPRPAESPLGRRGTRSDRRLEHRGRTAGRVRRSRLRDSRAAADRPADDTVRRSFIALDRDSHRAACAARGDPRRGLVRTGDP